MTRSTVVALLVFISTSSFAAKWKDGNGVEWAPAPIKSSFYRTAERCRDLGMRLPSSGDLLDAIEFGIFDSTVNFAFAKDIAAFDWMWVNDPGILGGRAMVSKQGDTAVDQASERHYGLCRSLKSAYDVE